MLRRVDYFGILMMTVLTGVSLLPAASIHKKDGTIVDGEIQGNVLLADPLGRPMYTLIAGKDIDLINDLGVQLKPNSVVVHTGMPLTTTLNVYRSIKAAEILHATLPLIEKTDPAEYNKNTGTLLLVMKGEVQGAGMGTLAIGKERAYFMKQIYEKREESYAVAGEVLAERGAYSVAPILRVQTTSGMVSLDVSMLFPLKTKMK